MRLVLVLAMLFPSVASAESLWVSNVSVGPAATMDAVEDGGFGLWGAGFATDNVYVGGELSFSSYDTLDDFGIAYHVLTGARARVSPRVSLLADVGAGITQQVEYHLGIFGGESGFSTEKITPSGAVRVHLVGELGRTQTARVAIGLTSEARGALDAGAGVGVGLGLYLSR
jgi:hypothetical protein